MGNAANFFEMQVAPGAKAGKASSKPRVAVSIPTEAAFQNLLLQVQKESKIPDSTVPTLGKFLQVSELHAKEISLSSESIRQFQPIPLPKGSVEMDASGQWIIKPEAQKRILSFLQPAKESEVKNPVAAPKKEKDSHNVEKNVSEPSEQAVPAFLGMMLSPDSQPKPAAAAPIPEKEISKPERSVQERPAVRKEIPPERFVQEQPVVRKESQPERFVQEQPVVRKDAKAEPRAEEGTLPNIALKAETITSPSTPDFAPALKTAQAVRKNPRSAADPVRVEKVFSHKQPAPSIAASSPSDISRLKETEQTFAAPSQPLETVVPDGKSEQTFVAPSNLSETTAPRKKAVRTESPSVPNGPESPVNTFVSQNLPNAEAVSHKESVSPKKEKAESTEVSRPNVLAGAPAESLSAESSPRPKPFLFVVHPKDVPHGGSFSSESAGSESLSQALESLVGDKFNLTAKVLKIETAAKETNSAPSWEGKGKDSGEKSVASSMQPAVSFEKSPIVTEAGLQVLRTLEQNPETAKKQETARVEFLKLEKANASPEQKPFPAHDTQNQTSDRPNSFFPQQVKAQLDQTALANMPSKKPEPAGPSKAAAAEEGSAASNAARAASMAPHPPQSPTAAHVAQEVNPGSMAAVYTEQIAKMQETVAQQVVKGVHGSFGTERSFVSIQLTPESLGKITVQMTMASGQLVAQIHAEKDSTRTLLERNLSALRTAFDDQGIKVERLVIAKDTQDYNRQDMNKEQSSDRPRSGRSESESRHPGGQKGENGDERNSSQQQRRGNPVWSDRLSARDYYM